LKAKPQAAQEEVQGEDRQKEQEGEDKTRQGEKVGAHRYDEKLFSSIRNFYRAFTLDLRGISPRRDHGHGAAARPGSRVLSVFRIYLTHASRLNPKPVLSDVEEPTRFLSAA